MIEGKEKEGEKMDLSKEGKREKWKAEGQGGRKSHTKIK